MEDPGRDARVRAELELDPSGRVNFRLRIFDVSEHNFSTDGETPIALDVGQADIDNNTPLPVVFIEVGCGAEFEPGSLVKGSAIADSRSERYFDVTIDGGGPCASPSPGTVRFDLKARYFQRVTVESTRGADEIVFSLQPRQRWVASSLDQRVARLPDIRYGVNPFWDIKALGDNTERKLPTGTSIRASIVAQPGEVAEVVAPAAEGGASIVPGDTPTWNLADYGEDLAMEPYVRWSDPALESLAQFLLVLSGVLLGVAASLAIEFILPRRGAAQTEAAADVSLRLQTEAIDLLNEVRKVLAETQLASRRDSWWKRYLVVGRKRRE
ncbi:hypothetical protein ACPW96_21490 [Micromonospora sp. DT81.3]|uniref:hypothetical protein n=1 Tax=Micromonospora sp. DT81.3 TaxID=3416523 RepID=UPI003CF3195B